MIRSFCALVSVALFTPAVGAQCPGGVCPVPTASPLARPLIQAAATPVQQVIGTGLHLAGNVVHPSAPWQPVAGWSARPRWYPGRRVIQLFR